MSTGLNVKLDNEIANPDLYLFKYIPEVAEPVYIMKQLLSSTSKYNFYNYSAADISRYLIIAAQSNQDSERKKALFSLQNFIAQNNNLIPIANENNISVKQKGLTGETILVDGTFLIDNIRFIE